MGAEFTVLTRLQWLGGSVGVKGKAEHLQVPPQEVYVHEGLRTSKNEKFFGMPVVENMQESSETQLAHADVSEPSQIDLHRGSLTSVKFAGDCIPSCLRAREQSQINREPHSFSLSQRAPEARQLFFSPSGRLPCNQ